jgi:hypothetical protein
MSVGFYVSIRRDTRQVCIALGPFDTNEQAEQHIEAVRQAAEEIDPWTGFDGFGTCRIEAPTLRAGKLNGRLAHLLPEREG